MQTIRKEIFRAEKIREIAAGHGRMDVALLERSAHALELLGRLVDAGVDPIFKGGTSLLLRLKAIRRLSIDVDIICKLSPKKLDPILREIGRKPPFLECEEHVRRKDGLPARRHFKFYFKSVLDGHRLPILLDVLEERNPYGKLNPISMANPLFELDHAIRVRVPTVEQLLGDKLTAFAPRTIGILFDPEATMQIAKQLFDIGQLFDAASDLDMVRHTYDRICRDQIGYRGNKHTRAQVLDDTFRVSLAFCRRGLAKDFDAEAGNLLWDGIQKMENYLVNCNFRTEEARVAASRAAFLCHLVRTGRCKGKLKPKKFDPSKKAVLGEKEILKPNGALNKLLATNAEAFFYWSEIFDVAQMAEKVIEDRVK